MLIQYDRKVLEQARKVADNPTSLQRDLLRFVHDEDVLAWNPDGGPYVSYLAPEALAEILNLMHRLPRRPSQNSYKRRNL